jgi:ABC-type glutathione transport system ATPase component
MPTPLPIALDVENLRIGIAGGGQPIVDGISFQAAAGEVLGIVGESGSGKSLTAYAIAGLLPPALAVAGGRIRVAGVDVSGLDRAERRRMAGSRIGIVFQDPLSSLNPVRRVGTALIESAMRHQRLDRRSARSLAIERMREMRLPDPERLIDAYPHQLSGGQRQRVMIALALINDPAVLIADEPTTALDATVQRSILALLRRQAAGRATILITHDLGVAASLCDRILVMLEGRIVESGRARDLLASPREAYTKMLVEAHRQLALPALDDVA